MNQFQQLDLFNKIWKFWPNKDKPHQARKAFKVLCVQEKIDPARMLAAAKIYCLELRTQHCHELGNWIRNDIYKDIYEEFHDIFKYEKKLEQRRKECVEIIHHWKRNKRDWWCSIQSEDDHIPQVEFAIRSKTFKEKWKEAFKVLHGTFSSPFPEGDWRSKINPSITWFCKVDYDSSTVLKLVEGEFGAAKKKKKKFDSKALFPKRKTMSQEDAEKSVSGLKNIFKGKDEKPTKRKFGF